MSDEKTLPPSGRNADSSASHNRNLPPPNRNNFNRHSARNHRADAADSTSSANPNAPASSKPGHPHHPNCMRPCPATLSQPPKTTEEKAKIQFNNRRNGPAGRRQPIPEPPKHPDGRAIRQPFDGQAHLYEVIQVRLARTQRLLEVNTNDLHLGPNASVLVRVHRNILLATTVGYRYRRVAEINSLPFIVRLASDEDRAIDNDNAQIEKKAQALATGFAIENNLQMKVLSADLSHDHKNITINFASDVRVDFRNMVAYMTSQLKLRVEMYQLGLRNGTGLICGLGSCGQLLCCGRFLGQFDPVAVKQLRAQGLAANPKRISGVCGRLYCCMSYEYVDYMREQRSLPRKGRRVFTRWGIGRVTDIDTLREDLVVTYENGDTQRIKPQDFLPVTEDVLARVESGEIEFPLEPARFYLNRDPSAACEMETKTQIRTAQSAHSSHPRIRRIEASIPSPKKSVVPARYEKLLKPQAAVKKAPHSAETSSPDTAVHPRHRRTTTVQPLRKTTRPVTSRAPSADESRITESAPSPAVSAESSHIAQRPVKPVKPATDPARPAQNNSQISRIPRKVKAHQANLEEAAAPKDNRFAPSRPSRRRYTPMNSGQPPEAGK